ncbi:glycine zipper 2TM domain-containing protein [Brevundimonas bullata]|uniref:glycine zipper 2TM domain-containing protein n=1 Tax=Brevundimonas bullata TaxID=13160 RepID=UPI000E0B2EC5|nr:glycine zipper 2TM domain-containing protein [Brevundimonas bullata]WQE38276.1 glycine zipper 2TM domain-containing protein [Brevundimonas bullata]
MIGHLSKKASAAAVAALAVAGSLMAPGVVSAQTYGYGYPPAYNSYGSQGRYNDPCVGDQRSRATGGGVLGAAIGAVAGSQLAARGRRTEGSVLGGVLGAAIGAGVGNSSANCDSRYRSNTGYNQSYSGTYVPPAYGYDNSGHDRRYDDGYGRDYREYDQGYSQPTPDYRYQNNQNNDDCRLAESVIRLPDGRSETRYVRTCPDQNGRYRVVD